jgi:adenine-specific DNA-methyltransferase
LNLGPSEDDQIALVKENELLKAEIAELKARPRLGYVWEEIPEAVEHRLLSEIPVLASDNSLDLVHDKSTPFAHILIEGDNLHALHTLQATHSQSVDVIYIDPPYNTGREFRYNDKLINKDDPFRHSTWMSFMAKRLRLAKNLLKETGVIFISIDDNEQHRLHSLCDSIFGEGNFIATFAWQNADTLKNDAKYVSPNSEGVLLFARNKQALVKFRGVLKGEKQRATYKNPDNDSRGPYLLTPLHAKSGNIANNFTFKFSNGQKWSPPIGTFHRFSKATLEELDREGRLLLDPKKIRVPQRKTFLAEVSERMPLWTFLRYEDFGSTRQSNKELARLVGQGKFPNPKPSNLIRKLIDAVADEKAVVLDFFAGSGTTLHSVCDLNNEDGGSRQVILVTNNENEICTEVTHPRIKALLSGNWDEGQHDPLPGNLRYFRTDFIKRTKNLDRLRSEISRYTFDLVSLKHGVTKEKKVRSDFRMMFADKVSIAVCITLEGDYSDAVLRAEKLARPGDKKIAYVFTWSDQGIEPELLEIWGGWQVEPLPAEMLAALRRNAPKEYQFRLPLHEGEVEA